MSALALDVPRYQTFNHSLYVAQQLGHFWTQGDPTVQCPMSIVKSLMKSAKVINSNQRQSQDGISHIPLLLLHHHHYHICHNRYCDIFRMACMECMQMFPSSELGLTKPLQLRGEPLSAISLCQCES